MSWHIWHIWLPVLPLLAVYAILIGGPLFGFNLFDKISCWLYDRAKAKARRLEATRLMRGLVASGCLACHDKATAVRLLQERFEVAFQNAIDDGVREMARNRAALYNLAFPLYAIQARASSGIDAEIDKISDLFKEFAYACAAGDLYEI